MDRCKAAAGGVLRRARNKLTDAKRLILAQSSSTSNDRESRKLTKGMPKQRKRRCWPCLPRTAESKVVLRSEHAGRLEQRLLDLQRKEQAKLSLQRQLQFHDKKVTELRGQICDKDRCLHGDNLLADGEVMMLEKSLAASRKAKIKIEAEMEELEMQWDEACASLDNICQALGADLLSIFVEMKVMEALPQSEEEQNPIEHAVLNDQPTSSVYMQQAEVCRAAMSELSDGAIVPDDRIEPIIPSEGASETASDERARMRNAFQQAADRALNAYLAFDGRLDRFDNEIKARELSRKAGKEVEDINEVHMRQFEETRRLTQEYAKADQEYYEAKDAAVAAGVDLRDDELESGFLNCSDDGYRISQEIEFAGFTNHVVIQEWVEALPPDQDTSEISEIGTAQTWNPGDSIDDLPGSWPEEAEIQPRKADDWDAESVQLWESRSMVAEGTEKRRIQKWQTLRTSQLAAMA